MNKLQKPLQPNAYFSDANPAHRLGDTTGAFPKEIEILHFTAGSRAVGAWSQFAANPTRLGYPVSTPYVIDKNGDVWCLFDDKWWSYALAIEDPKYVQNWRQDKRAVQIEISCEGPLEVGHDGETLTWNNGTIVYGKLSDPKCPPVLKLDEPFRGLQYFVPFTDAQVESTVELVASIAAAKGIAKVIPQVSRVIWTSTQGEHAVPCRFAFDLPYFSNFKGVCSHVNFRQHGKWDMAPEHSAPIWNGLLAAGFAEAK